MAESNKPKSNPATSNPIMQVLQDRFADAHDSLLKSATAEAATEAVAALSDQDFEKLTPLIKRARDSKQKTFNFQGFTIPVPHLSTSELIKHRNNVQEQNQNLLDSSFNLMGDQGAGLKAAAADFLGIKLKPKEEKKAEEKKPAKKKEPSAKKSPPKSEEKSSPRQESASTSVSEVFNTTKNADPDEEEITETKSSPATDIATSEQDKELAEIDNEWNRIAEEQAKTLGDSSPASSAAGTSTPSPASSATESEKAMVAEWDAAEKAVDRELANTNTLMRALLDKENISPQEAAALARAEHRFFKKNNELKQVLGDAGHVEKLQKLYAPVHEKLQRFPEANTAYREEDEKLYATKTEESSARDSASSVIQAQDDLTLTNALMEAMLEKEEIDPAEAEAFARAQDAIYKKDSRWYANAGLSDPLVRNNRLRTELFDKLKKSPEALSAYAKTEDELTGRKTSSSPTATSVAQEETIQRNIDNILKNEIEPTVKLLSELEAIAPDYIRAYDRIQEIREKTKDGSYQLEDVTGELNRLDRQLNRLKSSIKYPLDGDIRRAIENERTFLKHRRQEVGTLNDEIKQKDSVATGVGPLAVAAGVAGAALGLGGDVAATGTAPISGSRRFTKGTKATVTAQNAVETDTEISGQVEQTTKTDITAQTTVTAPGAPTATTGGGQIGINATATTTAQSSGGAGQSEGTALPSKIDISAQTTVSAPLGQAAPPPPGNINIQAKQQARQGFRHAPPTQAAGQSITVQGKQEVKQTTRQSGLAETPGEGQPQTIEGVGPASEASETPTLMAPGGIPPLPAATTSTLRGLGPATSGQPPVSKPTGPVRRMTGGGAPPVIRRQSAPGAGIRTQLGPQVSRPLGAAMQLGAAQQRARAFATSQTSVDEILGDSSVPQDVAEDIMSDNPRTGGGAYTPGFHDPMEPRDSHATRGRGPGSIATRTDSSEFETGGGTMTSDEEHRSQALSSAQQQQRALQANMPGGAGLALGAGAAMAAAGTGSSVGRRTPAMGTGNPDASEDENADTETEDDEADLDTALLLNAAQQEQRSQAVQGGAQGGVKGTVEAAQKAQKNLQNIWRVVNGVEILDAEFIFPIIMWLATANLQLINKYTFKVKFIPPAHMIEDALTCCIDCMLGVTGCMSLFLPIMISTIVILPYLVGGSVLGGIAYWLGGWDLVSPIVTEAINTIAK